MADIPGDATTDTRIRPGETYSGHFETLGDHDFIRVELEAGLYYAWDLDGPINEDPDRGPLERGFVNIYDTDGMRLTPNWRDVYFAPVESGTYYLDVWTKLNPGDTGAYTLEMLQPTGVSDLLRTIRTFNTVDASDSITVAFDTSDASGTWTPAARAAFEKAYDIIESVIDVSITTTTDEAGADWLLRVKTTDSTTSNFDLPGYLDQPQQVGNFAAWRIAAVEADAAAGRNGVDPFQMGHFLHELGHALGLSHTHDRSFGATSFEGVERSQDLGAFDLNQKIWTLMSYNSREPGNASLAALDIAALQDMYGANERANTGDDQYVLPRDLSLLDGWTTIWDTDGTDRILTAYDATYDVTIDLRPASLQYREGGGGFLSSRTPQPGETQFPAGFTIANGVDIEEAWGARGDDFLTGHNGENLLVGGNGNDSLRGLGGNDTLRGGNGNDILDGGTGRDFMDGGSGSDLYYVDSRKDGAFDSGSDQSATDRVITTADFNSDRTNIEIVEARGTSDVRLLGAYGARTEQTLIGNAGDNLLVLRDGKILATGGGGADQFLLQEERPYNREASTTIDLTITDFGSDDMLVFEDVSLFLGSSSTYYRTMSKAQGQLLMDRGIVDYDAQAGVIEITADDGEYTDRFRIDLGPDADIRYDQILLY